MGLFGSVLEWLLGPDKNPIVEVAQLFRENAEFGAQRAASARTAAFDQFDSEFANERKGVFDCFVDSLNRLPRPMMALGNIALFGQAMYDPVWFTSRMVGLGAVPEQL